MKKIAKISVAILCVSAITGSVHAAKTGSYVGAGLGVASVDRPNLSTKNLPSGVEIDLSKSGSDSGLGGRLFAGYNFNQYFGIEAGLAKYPNSKKTYKGTSTENSSYYLDTVQVADSNVYEGKSEVSNMFSFDVVGKGYLPLSDSGFNLYGLAGLAYVNSKQETSKTRTVSRAMTIDNITYVKDEDGKEYINGNEMRLKAADADQSTKHSKSGSAIHPIYGLGISYDIPQSSIVTNLEWTRLQGSATVLGSHKSPNANMWTLNFAYNLG